MKAEWVSEADSGIKAEQSKADLGIKAKWSKADLGSKAEWSKADLGVKAESIQGGKIVPRSGDSGFPVRESRFAAPCYPFRALLRVGPSPPPGRGEPPARG